MSRRSLLASASTALALFATSACVPDDTPLPAIGQANAESLAERSMRAKVTKLIESRDRALSLIKRFQPANTTPSGGGGIVSSIMPAARPSKQPGTLTEEEADYLVRATPVWLTPALGVLDSMAKSDIDMGDGIIFARRALRIHLQELRDEWQRRSRGGVIQELKEYVDTLNALFNSKKVVRFVRGRRWNGKEWITVK